MQRRKVELGDPSSALMTGDGANPTSGASASAAASSILNASPGGLISRPKRLPGSKANFNLTLNVILLSIAVLVAFVFLFPSHAVVDHGSSGISPDKVINDFRKSNQRQPRSQEEIEHELRQRIEKLPPKLIVQDRRKSKEASEAMARQSSKWVDGEKKLKQKLKVLYERQKKGLDLGVPILTRYLGEDIPAWVGAGVDEKEWRAKVDAKYAEMKEEETKWREEMKKIIENEPAIPF